MNRLRAVTWMSLIEAGFIAGGYLVTECCVTFLYGRMNAPFPYIVQYATEYWWLFVISTIGWASYALYAESGFRRVLFSRYLPYASGIVLIGFTVIFYVASVVVAAYGPPIHLAA